MLAVILTWNDVVFLRSNGSHYFGNLQIKTIIVIIDVKKLSNQYILY